MKDNKQYLKALEISLEMWEWLFENPDAEKYDWDKYSIYEDYLTYDNCAICTYRERQQLKYGYCINQKNKENICAFVSFCYNIKQGEVLTRYNREWSSWFYEHITTRKAFASDAVEAIKKEIERVKVEKEIKEDLGHIIKAIAKAADDFCFIQRLSDLDSKNLLKGEISMGTPDFGWALKQLKLGFKVAREGWNGKDMWIVLMPALNLPPFSSQEPGAKVNDRTARHIGDDTPLNSLPYIAMWTADKKWLPGWLASQTDMLSEDWYIVE